MILAESHQNVHGVN